MGEDLKSKLLSLQHWETIDIAESPTFVVQFIRLPPRSKQPERVAIQIKRKDAFRGLLIFKAEGIEELRQLIEKVAENIEKLKVMDEVNEELQKPRGGVEVKL